MSSDGYERGGCEGSARMAGGAYYGGETYLDESLGRKREGG